MTLDRSSKLVVLLLGLLFIGLITLGLVQLNTYDYATGRLLKCRELTTLLQSPPRGVHLLLSRVRILWFAIGGDVELLDKLTPEIIVSSPNKTVEEMTIFTTARRNSLEREVRRLHRDFLATAVIEVIIAVTVCILLFRSVRQSVLDRLKATASLTERLVDISIPIPVSSSSGNNDEIAVLEKQVLKLATSLRDAVRQARASLEHSADVICVVDVTCSFLSVSPACLSAWGYAPEELVGRNLREFVEDVGDSFSGLVGAPQSIDKIVFENRLRRKDGSLLFLLWSAHWSASDNGLFCVVHDITARKQAEELIRQSEERIRAVLEGLPVAVMLATVAGAIELANAHAESLTGCSADQLAKRTVGSLLQDNRSDKPVEMLNAPFIGYPVRLRKESGEFLNVELFARSIESAEGSKLLIAIVDVSEREKLDRLKREFVAMISHDIKTPLSTMTGILSLLEAGAYGKLNDTGLVAVARAKEETKRLTRLTKDLLDLEKMEAGKFSLRFEDVSLADVIAASADAVQGAATAAGIKIELPSNDLLCYADGARLIQVMVNLLSNAIKFSPVATSVIVRLEQPADDLAKITVSDQGRGIPKDKTALIFERFAQVEKSDQHEKGGSGLGLAICKAVVEQHSGTIGCHSTPGEGTCFWFTIPLKNAGKSGELVREH